MEIIIKNNKKYYRFKIGDEFTAISGKGSFNKMKKEGLCSDIYDIENGFIYPCLDASSSNNHIKGYSKLYNFEGHAIKVTIAGDSGISRYINGKFLNLENSDLLIQKDKLLPNWYLGIFLNNLLPNYKQGTAMTKVLYSYYKNEYIEIPVNHKELSQVIKRILEYKQLSKKLSKQIKDYKLSILQQSEKSIKHWKETNQLDKFITFKIGDEFESVSGKGSYNAMLKEGLCSDTYNEEQGFIYPFYDASTKNNHIKGYCKKYNTTNQGIKFSRKGDAGSSTYSYHKTSFLGDDSFLLVGRYSNFYSSLILNNILPNYATGTAQKGLQFNAISDVEIDLPKNHGLLSSKISTLNEWKIKVDKTTQQMEDYIEGVLQFSLK